MSNFMNFLIRMGVNSASVEAIGGRLVGLLSALNATNAGGYMNPNEIDGYTFNPSDGRWYGYPPAPDLGVYAWFDPANASKQNELNQDRYWRELNNHIEHTPPPEQGLAGDLSSPSLISLILQLPEIIDRYREIAPDIWRDLKNYMFPGSDRYNFPQGDPFTGMPWPGGDPGDWDEAERTVSPLVLDLDGDGVETTQLSRNMTSGTHFNLDARGLSENTGWAGGENKAANKPMWKAAA